jgi:acetylglutamate kinase
MATAHDPAGAVRLAALVHLIPATDLANRLAAHLRATELFLSSVGGVHAANAAELLDLVQAVAERVHSLEKQIRWDQEMRAKRA